MFCGESVSACRVLSDLSKVFVGFSFSSVGCHLEVLVTG